MSNIKRPKGGYGASDYRRSAAQGVSKAEAARDMGVSREAVRQMAVKYDISFADGRKSEFEARVIELHAKGYGNKEIAEQVGCHESTVANTLKRLGIVRNRISRSKYADALSQMADEGLTVSQAAERLGIKQPNVSQLAKRLGIKFRDGRRRISAPADPEKRRLMAGRAISAARVAGEG